MMIAVIFEVWPEAGHEDAYLEVAANLRELLTSIDGFISVERFRSVTAEGKLLSLSFFENDAAVTAWRNTLEHRKAQALGRGRYFSNYRLRIAEVKRDYGMNERDSAPADSHMHTTSNAKSAILWPNVTTVTHSIHCARTSHDPRTGSWAREDGVSN